MTDRNSPVIAVFSSTLQYGFVGHWLSPGRPTVGALDFGGASTQITFATREKVEDKGDVMTLRLYGHDYSLYTHSFLCYGKDQALIRLLAHIVTVEHVVPRDSNLRNLICLESVNPCASLRLRTTPSRSPTPAIQSTRAGL